MKVINHQPLTEEQCLQAHEGLVWTAVHQFTWATRNSVIDKDDLYSEGAIGLLKAFRNFDESYGVKFSTYAMPLITGEIRKYIRDYYHPVKYPRHMRTFDDGDYRKPVLSFNLKVFYSDKNDITLESQLSNEDDYSHLDFEDWLNDKPEPIRQIMVMRLSGKTQQEIADFMGVSQVHVSRLINREKVAI